MASPTIFSGRRTKVLTSDGILTSAGAIIDNDGVKNYISNGHAEVSTVGWVTYADAASARPIDGTGGTSTITLTRSTTTPLMGSASFILTSPGAVQGQGVSYDFTIDSKDKAKVLQISFEYLVNSGTFVAGSSAADSSLIPYIYNVGDAVLLEPSSIKLLSNATTLSDKFSATFQTSSTSTTYRLILHSATASAAFSLKIDNITVSPSVYVYGSPITDWQSYTPTGAWTTNSTYAGKWRRVGDTMEGVATVTLAGAPNAAALTMNLPAGYTIDSSKINNADGAFSIGMGSVLDNGAATYLLHTYFFSSTAIGTGIPNATGTYTYENGINATTPITFGVGDRVQLSFAVPILGWSSSVQMSDSSESRLIFSNYTLNTAQTLTRNAYTILNYDTKITDTAASVATGTSWKFTAVTSGQYKVSASINIGVVVPTTACELKIFINGVANRVITHTRTSSAYTPAYQKINGTTAIYLNAGDYIDVRAFFDHASTNSTTLNEPETGWLVIEKIASPATIAATESVKAGYNTSAGGSLANQAFTFIDFGTKDFDSHGSVLGAGLGNNATYTSTWRFVAPIPGLYSATSISIVNYPGSTDVQLVASIFVNGVDTCRGPQSRYITSSAGEYRGAFVSGDVQLKAGDIVSIGVFQGSGAARTMATSSGENRVTIKRVGN